MYVIRLGAGQSARGKQLMFGELLARLALEVCEMNQLSAGMLVRIIATGQLFQIDSVTENGRLWLSNYFSLTSVNSNEVELALDSRREQRAGVTDKAVSISRKTVDLATELSRRIRPRLSMH